jgi:hypothetical protein
MVDTFYADKLCPRCVRIKLTSGRDQVFWCNICKTEPTKDPEEAIEKAEIVTEGNDK